MGKRKRSETFTISILTLAKEFITERWLHSQYESMLDLCNNVTQWGVYGYIGIIYFSNFLGKEKRLLVHSTFNISSISFATRMISIHLFL